MIARERIYTALFDLVRATPGLKTSLRRYKPWSEVPAGEQPCFMQIQRGESAEVRPRLPTVWRASVNLVFYGHNGGHATLAPMSILNPIIDAVIARLEPPPSADEQTLGGLVERCRIDGEILTDEGVLGEQALAVIPVTILIPS